MSNGQDRRRGSSHLSLEQQPSRRLNRSRCSSKCRQKIGGRCCTLESIGGIASVVIATADKDSEAVLGTIHQIADVAPILGHTLGPAIEGNERIVAIDNVPRDPQIRRSGGASCKVEDAKHDQPQREALANVGCHYGTIFVGVAASGVCFRPRRGSRQKKGDAGSQGIPSGQCRSRDGSCHIEPSIERKQCLLRFSGM